MTDDREAAAADEVADSTRPPAVQTLGALDQWDSVQRAVSILLVASGIASALAAMLGWTSSGGGYALAAVLGVAGLFVGFARETLADRTPKQALVMAVTLVVVVAGLVGAFWVLRPHTSNLIVLEGDLNIAVLPFGIEDGGTNPSDDEFSSEFAEGVADSLSTSTEATLAGTGIRGDVRAMGRAPDVDRPAEELAARGAEIADAAHADFVVTGTVSFDSGRTIVRPLLYVAPDRVPDAPELSGWYDAGDALPMNADLRTNLPARGRAYQDLKDAMVTLVEVGLALEELSAGQPDLAVDRLEPIEREGEFQIVPRELALLFLGNALGREACLSGSCDERGLERAAVAYEGANVDATWFARGQVGLGELALQRGQGGGCDATQIVPADLDQAESLFQGVVDDQAAPPVADSKALLGLARVDACRAVAGVLGAGGDVRGIADTLVARALEGNAGDGYLAAEGRLFEAVTARVQGRSDEAVSALQDAISLSTRPERSAVWLDLLGQFVGMPPVCDLAWAADAFEASAEIYDDLIEVAEGDRRTTLQSQKAESERRLTEVGEGSACG